jgi:transcriptional regulator with XRE-family HTH domain
MKRQTLGMMIAARRKELELTQSELAARMGVTDKAVSKWERDLFCPDIQSLPALAEIFGMSVDELIQAGKSSEAQPVNAEADHVIDLILKAVPAAMGVAVTVLSVMNEIDLRSGFSMLGIAAVCLSIQALRREEKE